MPIGTTTYQDKRLSVLLLENLSVEIDASLVLDWVASEFLPEDIFEKEDLRTWALDNGFSEEE